MNNARLLAFFFIALLLPSMVLAASARIVADATAPGCFGLVEEEKNCHTLLINATEGFGSFITYNVSGVEPNKQYTVGFMYKLQKGSFKFKVPDAGITSGSMNDKTWKQYSVTFTSPSSVPALFKLRFEPETSDTIMWIDDLQMTPSPEITKFNNFKYEVGCCPFDFCWTGDVIKESPSCIHSKFYEKNVSMPPIGWDLADFGGKPNDPSSLLDAPNGYRCINGSWKFSTAKTTPLFDGAGYCTDDSQCFKGGGFPDAARACVNNGNITAYSGVKSDQPVEYFYCHNGNWTTRTKEIALQMLNMANQSTSNRYTIFCDRFDRSLNPDKTMSYYRDFVGDNIVTILTSGLVEEFCVMDLNGQIVAGVSLISEINSTPASGDTCYPGGIKCLTAGNCDENGCLLAQPEGFIVPSKSFVELLKGPDAKTYCDALLKDPAAVDGLYHQCNNKDVYYNPKLKSVLFTTTTEQVQNIPFPPTKTFIDVIFDYLKGILRNLLGIQGLALPSTEIVQAQQLDFISKAGSFDKLYISYSPDGPNGNPRSIRAIRETRAHRRADVGVDYKTFISAEYRNYQTDICNFFYRHNYHEVRAQISDPKADNIQCTPVILNNNEWLYSIYVDEPVFEDIDEDLKAIRIWKGASDTFWNDLTARIRTQTSPGKTGTSPTVPTFVSIPPNPVAGALMEFNISSGVEKLLAMTWDFNDSTKASSAFNVTTRHVFKEALVYNVVLCVMNNNYKIACGSPKPIDVKPAPQVTIEEQEQTADQKNNGDLTVKFTVNAGNLPYTIRVQWGDGSSNSTASNNVTAPFTLSGTTFTATHRYTQGKYMLNVTGKDSTGTYGVDYNNEKVVVVTKLV